MPGLLNKARYLTCLAVMAVILAGCAAATPPTTPTSPTSEKLKTREEAIPANAIKVTPETDGFVPELHSDEYSAPVPLDGGVNTAGGEDSAFIMPDGNTIYFFFTPDVSIPAEKQLFDGLTGIWVSRKQDGRWMPAERVLLQDKGELALDGCVVVQGDEMWFGSARKGNYRAIDIWTARFKEGKWTDWRNAGKKLNVEYEMGELHLTADGNEIYFHSARAGGMGGPDIWRTSKVNGEWQAPENIAAVNTPDTDGWPFVTQDGKELWITRWYMGAPAIFRSKRIDGQWGEPELILSRFAGEASVDNDGNVYFTHHFFRDGKMIEADIYVAYRK